MRTSITAAACLLLLGAAGLPDAVAAEVAGMWWGAAADA